MSEKLFEENLPQPLSNEEISNLFIKYQNGSEQARETLISHNIRLVIYEVCTHFKNAKYNKKDLVSIGSIGLIKAVDTYDLSKNTKFATYASKCINNEILMFLEKLRKDKNTQSLDKGEKKEENSSPVIIVDKTINLEHDYEQKEQEKELLLLLDLLPQREKQIIKMYFGFYQNKKYSQTEIAKVVSLSQTQIHRIIAKITTTLKELLQELSTGNPTILENEMEFPSLYDLLESFTVKEIDELLASPIEERSLMLLKGGMLDAKLPSKNLAILKSHKTKTTFLKFINYLLEFPSILDNLTLKEAIIFCFRLGYINKHRFSATSIANFLELDEKEVIEILRSTMLKISQNNQHKYSLKK